MNSMPSASNVLISLFKVSTLLAGIWSFADSSRTSVEKAMFDAQQKGSELALLLASSMGKPVYEKLGFKEYAMYSIYELPGNRKKNKQHIFYM